MAASILRLVRRSQEGVLHAGRYLSHIQRGDQYQDLGPDHFDRRSSQGAINLVYAMPNLHVEFVRVEPPGIPTAFWRSVGPSHNVFVTESFIDELAAAAKQDAVAYRRALLDHNPRAKAVLEVPPRDFHAWPLSIALARPSSLSGSSPRCFVLPSALAADPRNGRIRTGRPPQHSGHLHWRPDAAASRGQRRAR